jgi:hypothetical protein
MWGSVRAAVAALAVPGFALHSAAPPVHAQDAIVLAADGRTITAPASFAAGDTVRISVRRRPGPDPCTSERPEAGALIVRYRYVTLEEQPDRLTTDDNKAAVGGDGEFAIPPETNPGSGARLLVFNVWEGSADKAALPALETCVERLKAGVSELGKLEKSVRDAGVAAKAAGAAVALRRKRIEGLNEDVKAFQSVDVERSAEEIAALVRTMQAEREQLRSDEAAAESAETTLETETEALTKAVAEAGASVDALKGRVRRLEAYIKAKRAALELGKECWEAVVLKVGGAVVGDVKAVNYDLSARGADSVTAITPMGPYPTVRYGERLSVALLNVVDAQYPYPFSLKATAQAGAVINLSPVRPVFEPAGTVLAFGGTPADLSRCGSVVPAERVYRDLMLPVVGTFAPNDFAEVSISTERLDEDGKRVEVKLLEKAKLPTFRALYRFNFNSGVVSTALRQHTFQKVKTLDDDPDTKEEVETRFRTEEIVGERRVLPTFAVTMYWFPVDIQSPVTWSERLMPNPTIGFAITDPADDIFAGFSHELVRNLQLFYGIHFGKVDALVARNDVTEDRDATAPLVRARRDKAFMFGFTLNVNVVTKIFK